MWDVPSSSSEFAMGAATSNYALQVQDGEATFLSMRQRYLDLFDWYEEHLPGNVGRQKRERGVYPVLSVMLPPEVPIEFAMGFMKGCGIETRRWYTPPLHRHPLFVATGRYFPIADRLSRRLIGLPWHLHLTELQVIEVCAALVGAINEAAQHGIRSEEA
jgi:dTDP-4-amino-4,6-dideoxygalactose transaminase